MKKVLVELEMPELEKNECNHLILQKCLSLDEDESWQCIFCKTIIKQKKDEVQEEL